MLAIFISLIIIKPFISGIAHPLLDLLFTSITIAGLIVILCARRPDLQHLRWLQYPFSMFIAGLCLSLLGSLDIATSVTELYKTVPSILAFVICAYLDSSERRTMVFALICAAMVICSFAIYQRLFGFGHLKNYIAASAGSSPVALNYLLAKRVFFPFVTPNALAGYCALMMPLSLSEKRFYWTIAPLAVVLLLTQSLGAMFGLLAGIYLCLFLFPSKSGYWRVTLFIGVLALLMLIFWARISGRAMEQTAPGVMRLSYWRDTAAIIRSHPLFGVGIGNMSLKMSMFSHNFLLQLFAETGLLGLGGFIWVCWTVLSGAIKRYSGNRDLLTALLICSCVIFLLHNLSDFTLFLPEVSFIWWGFMGLLSSRLPGKNVQAA